MSIVLEHAAPAHRHAMCSLRATVVGAMSHMCIDATVRASSDFGYKTTVLHDACATRDLEFGGRVVPAAQVHAALMSALEFGYAKVVTTEAYLER